jgi:hypothetical protein
MYIYIKRIRKAQKVWVRADPDPEHCLQKKGLGKSAKIVTSVKTKVKQNLLLKK